jgi:hypothetical protein
LNSSTQIDSQKTSIPRSTVDQIVSCESILNSALKNCCCFFHHHVVFFLTLLFHESIHSSTAIYRLQNRCKPSKRENRKNGNQEGSEKGTCEESRRQEGAREEGRKKEVAVNQQQGNTRGGRSKRPPQCFRGRIKLIAEGTA